jgi:ubiquinone biosynthesis monooxygenase Coq7
MRSFPDAFIAELDTALRVSAAPASAPVRALPPAAAGIAAAETTREDKVESARLMRVNHTGEIAAQALYRGQAFVARNEALRARLLHAAEEEHDHLAWCEMRVTELGDRTSLLSPLWYGGSFAIGALAGLAGDGASLGFLAETEKQVVEHLDGHLDRLPPDDTRSRGIVEQMKRVEDAHRDSAVQHGGIELPGPVRGVMRATARIMTSVAYWI